MALIDQKEAARLIEREKVSVEDSSSAVSYNLGCDACAKIIERMKGQEIIHCKDCVYHAWDWVDAPYGMTQEIHWCDKFYTDENESLEVEPTDFCKWGERKGEAK